MMFQTKRLKSIEYGIKSLKSVINMQDEAIIRHQKVINELNQTILKITNDLKNARLYIDQQIRGVRNAFSQDTYKTDK